MLNGFLCLLFELTSSFVQDLNRCCFEVFVDVLLSLLLLCQLPAPLTPRGGHTEKMISKMSGKKREEKKNKFQLYIMFVYINYML